MKDKYKEKGSTAIRLIEECSELIMAVTKAERFGYDSHHPDRLTSNAREILREIKDVRSLCDEMEVRLRAGDYDDVQKDRDEKFDIKVLVGEWQCL